MSLLNAAENDQLLVAPIQHNCISFVYLTRSCNCDNLGQIRWRTRGFLKLRLVPLLLWISMLCWVRPCWGWAVWVSVHFSVLLYSTSRHLVVIFISLHICTGSFIVKRSARGGRSPVCRRFVTLLFMQAGDYMQSVNCPPHAMSATMSVIMLCIQISDNSKLKCLFTVRMHMFTYVYFHYSVLEILTVCSSVPWDTVREVDCPNQSRLAP